MLSNFLNDDELTAADGSFPRLLRLRKWLILASLAASLYGTNRVRADPIAEAFGNAVIVDHHLLWWAVLVPLSVLTLQYFLLLWQNTIVYSRTLSERFTRVQGRRLEEAQDRFEAAILQEKETRNTLNGNLEWYARDQMKLRMFKEKSTPKDETRPFETLIHELPPHVRNRHDSLRQKISSNQNEERDLREQLASLVAHRRVLEASLRRLRIADPSQVRAFRTLEAGGDLVRVAPAALLAVAAWTALFTSW